MNTAVTVRRPASYGLDEPVHFGPKNSDGVDGLAQASEAWFNVLNPLLQAKSIEPITPFKLGTEPTTLSIDPGNNVATAPAASRVYWVKDDNGAFDVGLPLVEGRTVALNSTGRKRAVLVDNTGNYTVTQAIDFPFVVNNAEPAISGLPLGCYTIQSQKTGKALQDMGNGAILQQPANGQNNQIFRIDDAGNNQVWFTTQTSSNKIITASTGRNGVDLSLTDYGPGSGTSQEPPFTSSPQVTQDIKSQWGIQQDGNSGNYRIFTNNGYTWDLRGGGSDPTLQLYGTTSEPFQDYRSFRFNAVTCPGTTSTPPPANDACSSFTNGTVVGQRTYQTDVKIVVAVNGSCKQAVWSNGNGVVHRNWLLNNNSTAINGFTLTNIGQCLTFDGEACTGGTTPNPCDFTVSVSTPTPTVSPNAGVQFTAQCNGQCTGVTYSWSGPNFSQQNANPVNVTAPGSAGQYTYTLTASKANCASKTATAQLTVSGGGSSGSRCAAFTNGTEIGYRSGNTGVKVVVQDDGVCRKAMWSNGDGQMHPNWIPYATFYSTFSMDDIRYCLTFDGEACKRPASVTPAPAPATAFAVGSTGSGMADESPARVSSGARASETAPAPPETGSELVAYPNPTSDVLTVRLDQPLPANPIFTLTDMSGRTYEVGSHLSVLSARRIKLSVRHLTTGQYVLQIGGDPVLGEGFRPRTVRFVKL